MKLLGSIIIGTLYTIVGFALSFLFLHLAIMFWFHQTGFEFLIELDSGRSAMHQQAAMISPGSFQDIILRDNVYYFIITIIVFAIWILNINHHYNNES